MSYSPEELQAFEVEVRRLGPLAAFPWHPQQELALRAATDVIAVIGGNRSGKSKTGEGIVARVARREGPVYRRLKDPEGRRLKIWVAPQTFEKYKSLWESRLRSALEGMRYTYVQTPHPVFTIEDAEGGVEIWGKAQEQGFLSFESDDVDIVVFDEEPADRRVYTSAKTRLATTNGVIVLTFTPLLGMTWTFGEFWLPAVADEHKVADRAWRLGNALTVVNMGMADNPAAVAGGGVQRILDDPGMTQAEKDTRLLGSYGFVEGLIFPDVATLRVDLRPEDPAAIYLLDALPPNRPYEWLLTADPNKRHAAVLTAWDDDGNRYVCGEHYAEGLPDSLHAEAYRELLLTFKLRPQDVTTFADPGGAGAQAILNLAEVGIDAQAVPKDAGSVAASIKRLRRALYKDPGHKHPVTGKKGAPRCYFLRSLQTQWSDGAASYRESRVLWELRQYRQKPDQAPDTPIKEKDDAVDCLRYAELVRMIEPPTPVDHQLLELRARLDHASRQEAEGFDKLLTRLSKLRVEAR